MNIELPKGAKVHPVHCVAREPKKICAGIDEGHVCYVDLSGEWDVCEGGPAPNCVLFFDWETGRGVYEALKELFDPKPVTDPPWEREAKP